MMETCWLRLIFISVSLLFFIFGLFAAYNDSFQVPTALMAKIQSGDSSILWKKKLKNKDGIGLANDVTIVTAFIHIGDHKKGTGQMRHMKTYYSWMYSWAKIRNPTVFYSDSKEFMEGFSRYRFRYRNATLIRNVTRSSLWSFRQVPKIKEIFAQPGYPKHNPNTVVATYPAVMSSKYDFLERTINENPFNTRYFMWLDLGLFRGYPRSASCFEIRSPLGFQDDKIAVNSLSPVRKAKARDIVYKNLVAVGGGVIFGKWDVLLRYIDQYRYGVARLMDRNLMSTDQQVIFSLYGDAEIAGNRTLVPLQPYKMKSRQRYNGDPWFYLAYAMTNDVPCP